MGKAYAYGMTEEKNFDTARWLRRRDAWMRSLVSNGFVSRNGKLVGFHIALRLSAKKPYCYPAMKSVGQSLGISPRHVARALKELEEEGWLKVKRVPGKTSLYRLDL